MRNPAFRRAVLGVMAGALALGVTACAAHPYRDPNGSVTATASVSIGAVQVGDCVYNVSTLVNPVTTVQVVPCSSPHEGEVVGSETNVANVESDLENFCKDQFALYVGIDTDSTVLTVNVFLSADSTATTTDVECIAFMPGQMVTTSYKGTGQ